MANKDDFVEQVFDVSGYKPEKIIPACKCTRHLQYYITDGVTICNICKVINNINVGMYGCQVCNFDICETCMNSNQKCNNILNNFELPYDFRMLSICKINRSIDKYSKTYEDTTNYGFR